MSDIRETCTKLWKKICFYPEGEKHSAIITSLEIYINLKVGRKSNFLYIEYYRKRKLPGIYDTQAWEYKFAALEDRKATSSYEPNDRIYIKTTRLDKEELEEELENRGITLQELFEESLKILKEKRVYSLKNFS